MALKPELIRRRKRIEMPRAPLRRLGEKEAIAPKGANEELKELLEQLLKEAELNTLFTMTLERDRLISALYYAGFLVPLWFTSEVQLAPLATTTVFGVVPPGTVFVPREMTASVSLPWWLSVGIWVDSDPPAAPIFAIVRCPENFHMLFGGLIPIRRYVRATLTNNHAVNTINTCMIEELAYMPEASWKMLETIYLKPIAEYAQEKAEELTGRPYP